MKNRGWIAIIVVLLIALSLACGGGGDDTPTPEEDNGDIVSEVKATDTPMPTEEPPEPEATSTPLTSSTGLSLEIINDSDDTITTLYISPTESDTWGSNWLNGSVAPEESQLIEEIEPGTYDLQVGNEEGSLETLYNAELDSDRTWTVWGQASVPENAVLRFDDDFSDNRNNWGGTENDNVNYMTPSGGEYCMHIKVENMTAWEWYEPFRPDEFFAEVKCRVDVNTDASCGLGFGPDADNLFWYEIDSESQSYAVFLLQDDAWQDPLIEWTNDLHISPDGQNYLGLGRLQGTLFIYVNGSLIDAIDTDLFPTGRIGIGGATYDDPDVTVCLDDLRVWRIE
jgi:hypothetical protein